MIIFKSTTNKDHLYKCDRCGTMLHVPKEVVYSIYVRTTMMRSPKKKWDLCERDYRALEKGIEKNK
jgi:hypothetical protein